MQCEFLERSGEEQDELQQSTKRVKDVSNDVGQVEERRVLEDARRKSYRDKLVGDFPRAHAQMCLANNYYVGEEESDNEMDEVT